MLVPIQKTATGATVTVYDGGGSLKRRHVFEELEFEAFGGFTGLWIPVVQPMRDEFLIMNCGADAGQTLMVQTNGKLLEFPGGFYTYDKQAGRLFLRADTDVDGLTTVLDENANLVCASGRPDDLRDKSGQRIATPGQFDFVCLPELAATARRQTPGVSKAGSILNRPC